MTCTGRRVHSDFFTHGSAPQTFSPRARSSPRTFSMPSLSIMRIPLEDTRKLTKRFSDSTQKRWLCKFGKKRRRVRFLAFDEMQISDITDAMILAGLLDAMFRLGIVLVATSNVEPKRLYENGLQRSKFMPAIALIQGHTQTLNVDGGVDYRLRALESAEIYHFPLDSGADESLERSFSSLSPDAGAVNVALEIEGRVIQARMAGDGVVWFDFLKICDGPRSQNDYIELAMLFQTVLVGGVPQFTSQTENAARRFISLVDEFYDHNVKLILSAEVAILDLYAGERLKFEFQRTESRLQEMQSHEYLSQEHLP